MSSPTYLPACLLPPAIRLPAQAGRALSRALFAAGMLWQPDCGPHTLLVCPLRWPACRDLWRLLRPASAAPDAVRVEGGPGADGSSSSLDGKVAGNAAKLSVGAQTQLMLDSSGGQKAGAGADLVAAQLEEALQVGGRGAGWWCFAAAAAACLLACCCCCCRFCGRQAGPSHLACLLPPTPRATHISNFSRTPLRT